MKNPYTKRTGVFKPRNMESKNLFGETVPSPSPEPKSEPKEKGEIIKVESFSNSGIFYNVNKTYKTCSCPAFKKTGHREMCKHLKRVLGIKDSSNGFSKSLLKSALQKAVRRNDVGKAVRCTKALMGLDEVDFLRRVIVVVIEDGLLHPYLSDVKDILVRVSSAGGAKLSEDEKQKIIDMIAEVTACEWRDNWVDEEAEFTDSPEEQEAIKYEAENFKVEIGKEEKRLVDMIKYRSQIGGMKSDVVMLGHYHRMWLMRFGKKEWDIEKIKGYFKPQNLKLKDVGKVEKSDIILVAIDMHCSPLINILLRKDWVVTLITTNFPNITDVKRKLIELLWRQMSSVNYKKEIGSGQVRDWYIMGSGKLVDREKEEYVWSQLKTEINNIQLWFLSKQQEE